MVQARSDASIDLDQASLDELGRVPECRTDEAHVQHDTAIIPEPHSIHCGDNSRRELHCNSFPLDEPTA